MNENCTFCNLLMDEKNISRIKTMKYGVLFVNYNQYYKGRLMYVYNKHAHDITEIDEDTLIVIQKEILHICKIIKQLYSPDTINIATLGNYVQHLHWHIIPRYKDDITWGNPPWPHDRKIINDDEILKMKITYQNIINNI